MMTRKSVTAICCLVMLAVLAGPACALDGNFKVESREKRLNQRQPPVAIMNAVGIEPGMVIGEIGAGSGRMTMWLADRIGPGGRLYANDINEESLDKLAARSRKAGFDQIEIIVGEIDDPLLPEGALDIMFMINVYHHLDDAVALLRNALPSLKEDGLLVIVECDPDKTDWGEGHHCTSRPDMIRELKEAGYEMVRTEDFLDEDTIYIARAARGH